MLIVAVLLMSVAAIVLMKTRDAAAPALTTSQPATAARLPRMVDLGADKCIPCKMMAPILEELRREYAGQLEVEFIDVWKNSAPAEEYGVNTIPTQIFFDASGKERFRHEGFFGKEDILAKWKELGVNLAIGSAPAAASQPG